MFRRQDIRYHTPWVRLVCCLALAIGLGNAVRAGVFAPLEAALRYLLVYSEADYFRYVGRDGEIALLAALCLLPALPRIERPLAMIAWGGSLVFAYLYTLLGILLTRNLVLPVAAPVIGLLASTAVLETMAWSEERFRRRSLERLEQARQQFADMLVHDLKKRLSSVLLSLSALEQAGGAAAGTDAAPPGRARELMVAIRAGAHRMLLLINDLLDIRRIEEGGLDLRREETGIRSLVAECVAEHRAEAELLGVRLALLDGDDGRVRADRELLLRVLSNLLWNAMQHAPRDSAVELGCGTDGSRTVTFHVANLGAPIPAREKARLFRPFVAAGTSRAAAPLGSTGLGLAFCRLAVEAHGGRIALQSPWRDGDGVRVEVRLPAAP